MSQRDPLTHGRVPNGKKNNLTPISIWPFGTLLSRSILEWQELALKVFAPLIKARTETKL